MRELAGWQEDQYARVAGWSLREALLAYVELGRRRAREAYDRECDRYVHGRQVPDSEKPTKPAILANNGEAL